MLDLENQSPPTACTNCFDGLTHRSGSESRTVCRSREPNAQEAQTEMNDPLFIRVWRGLTPTDTTTMMLPVVRELLEQNGAAGISKTFTPAKLSATITIGAADNSVISILPPVVRAIREQAPKVNFRILPLESRQFQKLADGGMDFLLYPTQNLPDLPTHFGSQSFRIERSVLMNRAHPLIKAYEAGQTLKAEDFRKYPRILVKLQDSSRGSIYDVTVPDPRLGEAFIELPYFLRSPLFPRRHRVHAGAADTNGEIL